MLQKISSAYNQDLQKIEARTTRREEPAQKMKDPTMEWKKVLFQEGNNLSLVHWEIMV
jgi:hypothetical protein